MNVNFSSIKFNPISKISTTNNNRVNFQAKADTVELSADAKEKAQIIKNLTDIGYTSERASEMVKKYYKNDVMERAMTLRELMDFLDNQTPVGYSELVNGDKKGKPVHYVECLDRNLTPTEAVVYLAEDMRDYYKQDSVMRPNPRSSEYVPADFTPLELAECMNQGLEIVPAGMVLKGSMDHDTAKRVSEHLTPETYYYYDLRGAANAFGKEQVYKRIAGSIDEIDLYTSDERNSDGTLKSGLTRPLRNDEAVRLADNGCPMNSKAINNYLLINKTKGWDMLYLNDEDWQSDRAEMIQRFANDVKFMEKSCL